MAYDLKKESDVKEYLEKLGVEYRFGCYSEKKPEVCHLLGDFLEGIKKDYQKAGVVYKSTCDDYGYAKSCYKYGNYSFLGKGKPGTKRDAKGAYSYYEKGCALEDSDACLHSGLLLVSRSMAKEIDRDVPKGVEMITKSCNMNNAAACFYLSGLYISGVEKTIKECQPATKKEEMKVSDVAVSRDMKKAFDFAYKACELRNMYACANLSQMYARGDGVEKDKLLAEHFRKVAVTMQNEVKKQNTLEFQQGLKAPQ